MSVGASPGGVREGMPTRKQGSGRSLYKDLIVESTGCSPEQAREVEDVMRGEHGTLDGLTRPRFAAAARRAHEVCKTLGLLGPETDPFSLKLEGDYVVIGREGMTAVEVFPLSVDPFEFPKALGELSPRAKRELEEHDRAHRARQR